MMKLFAETLTYCYFKKQPPLLKPLWKRQKCQICGFSNSHYKVHFYVHFQFAPEWKCHRLELQLEIKKRRILDLAELKMRQSII